MSVFSPRMPFYLQNKKICQNKWLKSEKTKMCAWCTFHLYEMTQAHILHKSIYLCCVYTHTHTHTHISMTL